MPTFATPGPIAATVQVAGAQVRVTASDRTDTVVLVEPINVASRSDVKVANKTKVDFASGRLSVKHRGRHQRGTAASIDVNSERGAVHNFVSSQGDSDPSDDKVMVHARARHGDIIIQRTAC
jgi:hypothetical protein